MNVFEIYEVNMEISDVKKNMFKLKLPEVYFRNKPSDYYLQMIETTSHECRIHEGLLQLFCIRFQNDLLKNCFNNYTFDNLLFRFSPFSRTIIDEYRKYGRYEVYGRHNHHIATAYNDEMRQAIMKTFYYYRSFSVKDVEQMISNVESARNNGSYQIGSYIYKASFNNYSSDKLRDICLQLIKDRKVITDKIQAGAILPHRACYEMIMLYRQFIADYENEAVDVLTHCIYQAARNYDES